MQSEWIRIQSGEGLVGRDSGKRAPGAERTGARARRLAAIRDIIARTAADSQEKLIGLLRREGFAATQATLSRDLTFLGIAKVPRPGGGYTYALPVDGARAAPAGSLVQDFTRGFVSLEFSGSFGLIKTLPGHAASVASALDGLAIGAVLGTVAGDDTILVVPRDGVSRAAMVKALRARLPVV
jgi:transcriptional regulator of arginine metabolism